ncbi:MAG TPA: SDR family NAD(P)-dependent oxidoreductase [Candidatus Limnocylindrales bacterium]|nr:SDR family NAD(P)-dependent oxidoreductase [Candidatus Limnocylindrales bacterium]
MSWKLEGGVAVITGAASGIGRALAHRLAREKMSLALADIDESGLLDTARRIETKKISLTTHILDVGNARAMEDFTSDVVQRHQRVTLLINNAGVALHGNFEEISLADFEWLMQINFWGVVYGVRNFLPLLRRQPRAHIVNVSSLFGLISPAGQSAYCSAKFAVRGFTEVLQHELEGTSVGVSCVHPGGIRTAIAGRARVGAGVHPAIRDLNVARFERLAITSPEAAADRIVRGVKRNEPRILVGPDAVRLDRLQRFLPVRYWKMLVKQTENAAPPQPSVPTSSD